MFPAELTRHLPTLSPRDSAVQLLRLSYQTENNPRMDAETNKRPRTTHREDKDVVGRAGEVDRLKM